MRDSEQLKELKEKIYQQIQEILLNDELEDQQKIDLLDNAYGILSE